MNNTELNHCYRSCKDLLFQLGLVPSDKTLKEMMSCIDIPVPDVLSVRDPSGTDFAWTEPFQNLVNGLKYTDASQKEETNFYKAAKEMDRMHSKTAHGYLSAGPNMFARALNIYVIQKLGEEGKTYHFPEFENRNHIWYGGYYKTRPTPEESRKFNVLFDNLITYLKEKGIVSELTVPKKTNMKEVKDLVASRREGYSSSYQKTAQRSQMGKVSSRFSQ